MIFNEDFKQKANTLYDDIINYYLDYYVANCDELAYYSVNTPAERESYVLEQLLKVDDIVYDLSEDGIIGEIYGDDEYDYVTGATRIVFPNIDNNYVVKLGFSFDWDDNYNLNEARHYVDIVDLYPNLAKYFAKTAILETKTYTVESRYAGTLDICVAMTAMEKVEMAENDMYSNYLTSRHNYSEAVQETVKSYYIILSPAAVFNFLERSDKPTLDDIVELDDVLDNFEINDLHYGNFGYRKGDLVILDYAGYYAFD